MSFDLNALSRRLEGAQALQNEQFNRASGGLSRPLGGGFAHFRGEGHPLNQALGLVDPVAEAELAEAEAFLGLGGHPVVLELSPAADPALWPLLAARGYRLHQFQQLLARPLPAPEPLPAPFEIRVIGDEESELMARVVFAGFTGRDDWEGLDVPFSTPSGVSGSWRFLALVDGEPAGGATLGVFDGVSLLSGDAVLPRFRGRGLQKALIAARLRLAAEAGAEWACASTLPSTPSQRAYEACGFRVMYPKVEMAK